VLNSPGSQVYPVRQGTSKVGYIARCLDLIAELGLKVEVLCFGPGVLYPEGVWISDSGTGAVHRPCQETRQTNEKAAARDAVPVCRVPDESQTVTSPADRGSVNHAKGKRGKHGVENLGYVVGDLAWNPRRVHQTYRARFSIESSYRMCNQVKPRTSTKNPAIRYLYVIISFLLKKQHAGNDWDERMLYTNDENTGNVIHIRNFVTLPTAP
jgi:putative transposase